MRGVVDSYTHVIFVGVRVGVEIWEREGGVEFEGRGENGIDVEGGGV